MFKLPIRRKALQTSRSATAILFPPVLATSRKSSTEQKTLDLPNYLTTITTRTDSTYQGTRYEYTALACLHRLGFTLSHNGGANDKGIDLIGTWTLPSSPSPSSQTPSTPPSPPTLKVLIQCKSTISKILPSAMRELEGAFAGAPFEWRGPQGVVAFLVARKPPTRGVMAAMARSRWPMGFITLESEDREKAGEGRVVQMTWNRRAEDEGLAGVGIVLRYSGNGEGERVVALTWKGGPVGD